MFMCVKLNSLFDSEMKVFYVTSKQIVLTTYSNLKT